MRFQLASDLHLEGYLSPKAVWKRLTPSADTLVVPGDVNANYFVSSVNELAKRFKRVVVVMGNHDYTDQTIEYQPTGLSENVSLLNPGVVEIEDTVFIGATLWSDLDDSDWFVVNTVRTNVCDFTDIQEWNPVKMTLQHKKDKDYLRLMLKKYEGRKVVVVTHFLPSYRLISAHYRQPCYETLNRYFSSNCDELMLDLNGDLVTWVYGHVHDFNATTCHGIRCFCNPMGIKKSEYFSTYRNFLIDT